MNNQQRHEKRYQRRKAKREEKRIAKSKSCGDFKNVFSYENLYNAGKQCAKNVGWKSSTQAYIDKLPTNTYKNYHALHNGDFQSKGFIEFNIYERGKQRHIRSVHISERVIQKVLCDKVIVPIHTATFIYDNGASQKGKGTDFSMDRLTRNLQRHYRKHGNDGYILLMDFKSYFDSIPHSVIYSENEKRLHDPKIRKLANQFMEDFGEVGLGLGSQVSQTYALLAASSIDHFIKERLRIKGYARYMDDCYLIHPDKEYLTYCYSEIKKKCAETGITPNEKKCKIVPLSKGFKFLKTKFTLTETGKIYRKMNPQSSKIMRSKLKIFRRWVHEGRFTLEDVECTFQSYLGHMKRGNSYNKIKQMESFYNELFPERKRF